MRLIIVCLVVLGCFETKAQEIAGEPISIEDAKPALEVGECAGFYQFLSEHFSPLDKKKSEFYQEIALGTSIISSRLFREMGIDEEKSYDISSSVVRRAVIELDAVKISGDPEGIILETTKLCSHLAGKALTVMGK